MKIIFKGDLLYGNALTTAKDWILQYNKEGRTGLCGFRSERNNVFGFVDTLKSGTIKAGVWEIRHG